MRRSPRTILALTHITALLAAACGTPGGGDVGPEDLSIADTDLVKAGPGKADSSATAVFLDFAFKGELQTRWATRPEAQIEDQLLFTIGQLNGERAVGRLDKLELSDIETEAGEGGAVTIRYRAKLLVAWSKRATVPAQYTLRLPRDVSFQGQADFTDKYSHDCVDWGAHDVTAGSMWYYYRPARTGCALDEADVLDAVAEVSPSPAETTGKYPEYDLVWSDGVLNVVAVFGKVTDGATGLGDQGIGAYNDFQRRVRALLGASEMVVTPEDAPSNPGVDVPEIRYEAVIDEAHKVVVTTLLVDNVRTAGPEFDARYAELSSSADLIAYNGHAGLGANIKALARKGSWVGGQYVVVFMNGCDTYAYVDTALFEAHAAVNPEDPSGTKHVDIVTNAMPSFFRSMSRATEAMVAGLLAYDEPRTDGRIFRDIDPSPVVLVSGEEDNTFVPGGAGPAGPVDVPPGEWSGLSLEGTLAAGATERFETPVLAAGTYEFQLSGRGDADLYVRVGKAPSDTEWDCRPYRAGGDETCVVDLPGPAAIHGRVVGASSESTYELLAGRR